jgi:3-methyladenine DNA glycosylase AlkD
MNACPDTKFKELQMPAKSTPKRVAAELRAALKRGGSAEHAKGVQWFFKEDVKSHGWYTAPLRRFSRQVRAEILKQHDMQFLVQVADNMFNGRVLEEKIFAVFLLENLTSSLGPRHFRLFESWIGRISSWADHDGLVHYLIAPMVAADRARARRVFVWAKFRDRWHRRAACVALIQGRQHREFFRETVRLSNILLNDEDDIVQKGLGWLLRVTAKVAPKETISYLMSIRNRAPRLVLRTACESLSPAQRKQVLSRQVK